MKSEEPGYFPVLQQLIEPGKILPFTCHVYLPNNDKIVPAFHANDVISPEKLHKITVSESGHFFVLQTDVQNYFDYLNAQLDIPAHETLRAFVRGEFQKGNIGYFLVAENTVGVDLLKVFTNRERLNLETEIGDLGVKQSVLVQKIVDLIKNIRPNFGSLIGQWIEFFAIAKRKFNPDDAMRAGEIAKSLQEFEGRLFSELKKDLNQLQNQFGDTLQAIRKINPDVEFPFSEIVISDEPVLSWELDEEKEKAKAKIRQEREISIIDPEKEHLEKLELENAWLKNQLEAVQDVTEKNKHVTSVKTESELEFQEIAQKQKSELQENQLMIEHLRKRNQTLESEISQIRGKVIEMNRSQGKKRNEPADEDSKSAFLEVEKDLLDAEILGLKAQLESQAFSEENHKSVYRNWEARRRAMERLLSIYRHQLEKFKEERKELQQFKVSAVGQTKEIITDKRNIVQQSVILGSQLQIEMKKSQNLQEQIEAFKKREFEIRQSALQTSVEQEKLKLEIQNLHNRVAELSSDDRSDKLRHLEQVLKTLEQKLEFEKLETKEYKIRFAQEQNKVHGLEKELRSLNTKLKRSS